MFYRKKTIDAKLADLELQVNILRNQLNTLHTTLPDTIRAAIDSNTMQQEAIEVKTADERQKSDIPFVEIISDGYDSELGVQLQLDWNAAFIKELKSKGYTGSSERDTVNKWLIAVHKQLAEEFEKSDRV